MVFIRGDFGIANVEIAPGGQRKALYETIQGFPVLFRTVLHVGLLRVANLLIVSAGESLKMMLMMDSMKADFLDGESGLVGSMMSFTGDKCFEEFLLFCWQGG